MYPMLNKAPLHEDVWGEWIYSCICSWQRHKLDVNGQLEATAALPPGKQRLVLTG